MELSPSVRAINVIAKDGSPRNLTAGLECLERCNIQTSLHVPPLWWTCPSSPSRSLLLTDILNPLFLLFSLGNFPPFIGPMLPNFEKNISILQICLCEFAIDINNFMFQSLKNIEPSIIDLIHETM